MPTKQPPCATFLYFVARYSIILYRWLFGCISYACKHNRRDIIVASPKSSYRETRNDFSSEKSNWGVNIVDLTAANVVAQTALLATLKTAVDGIVNTSRVSSETVFDKTNVGGGTPPTDPLAQRENKWLVRYVGDATFKVFTTEIPGADLTLLSTDPQTDFADLSGGAMTSFVSAFEAVVRSPEDPTETVTIRDVQFVGRRL